MPKRFKVAIHSILNRSSGLLIVRARSLAAEGKTAGNDSKKAAA
jgi:hypothetical protein